MSAFIIKTTAGDVVKKNYLTGFILSNGTDTVNDISVSAGVCRDSTDSYDITVSAMTKQLDAAWAAGNNAGGRDTGAISDNWWHVFAIHNPTTGVSDVLFSLSLTSPTYPSGYTAKRRIGSILRNVATYSGVRQFYQIDDFFQWNPTGGEGTATVGPPSYTYMVMTVPPGIRFQSLIQFSAYNNTGFCYMYFRDPAQTAESQGLIFCPSANHQVAAERTLYTDTSSQVMLAYTTGSGAVFFNAGAIGWWDQRGKTGYALY